MIDIIVNLVPYGQRGYTRQIAGMQIWNDATGDYTIGNYGYKLTNGHGYVTSTGEIKGFVREKGIEYLVKEVLNDAL